MTPRRDDWFERLRTVVVKHGSIPFVYGKSDCLRFPLECAEAMTGEAIDIPAYSTEAGAAKALMKRDFLTVADAFASHFEEIPPAMAQRGDLVWCLHGNQAAGGVCLGRECAVKSETGLVFLPITDAKRAFRVG